MPYFDEPVGWVKIQTTGKNSQWYYTTKRVIRDLLSNTSNCYVRASEFRGYLFTGNAWQKYAKRNRIGAGNPGKLILWFRPRHHWRNLFHFSQRKNCLSIVQITHQLKFFTLRFLSRKKAAKKFVLTNKNCFRNFNPIRCLRVAIKPVSPVLWSTNTAWHLSSFLALFVIYEVQLDDNIFYLFVFKWLAWLGNKFRDPSKRTCKSTKTQSGKRNNPSCKVSIF